MKKGRLMITPSGNYCLTDIDKQHLANPVVGGAILFARHFKNSQQLRQLCASIRQTVKRPFLIAVDQEGGRVQRFAGEKISSIPAMLTLAKNKDSASLLYASGIVIAAELISHGIDLTFAPVLDLAYGRSDIIGNRAFASQADDVASLTQYFSKGLLDAGMLACGKHFPGHGYALADSHLELPVDERKEIDSDLLPFSSFIKWGGRLIMTAHICYPHFDSHPATFSSVWLKTYLRDYLGYRYAIVSDDLSMMGAMVVGDISDRLHAAADAGCDLWLVCNSMDTATAITAAEKRIEKSEFHWQDLINWQFPRIDIGSQEYQKRRMQLQQFN